MTAVDRKLNSRIELINPKRGVAMMTISNNPQLLLTEGVAKVLARVQLTEATPKQAGGGAGELELASGHEVNFAARGHQPPARTGESLDPRRLHCRGLPAPLYRRATADLERDAPGAHAFVGVANEHAFAQSAGDATTRASRVAAPIHPARGNRRFSGAPPRPRGRSNSATRETGRCADALELLFRAAAQAGEGGKTLPLPAVMDSFVQWRRQTEEDFRLIQHIDAQLETRKHPVSLTKTYGQWREEAIKHPNLARTYGFRDDPKKTDNESLTLTAEMFPVRAPAARKAVTPF